RSGDCTHSDEVVGTTEECRESRGKCNLSAGRQSYCSSDHLLFRNEYFEEAFGISLAKLLRIRRIAHFSIEHNDIRAGCAESLELVAIGLTRGNRLVIYRQFKLAFDLNLRGLFIFRLGRLDDQTRFATEFFDGFFRLLFAQSLAMPAVF